MNSSTDVRDLDLWEHAIFLYPLIISDYGDHSSSGALHSNFFASMTSSGRGTTRPVPQIPTLVRHNENLARFSSSPEIVGLAWYPVHPICGSHESTMAATGGSTVAEIPSLQDWGGEARVRDRHDIAPYSTSVDDLQIFSPRSSRQEASRLEDL